MFVIGITGGIGTGKSTVAKILGSFGLPVLDADQISHELTKAQGPLIGAIKEAFGAEYITEEQALDRQKMAALVFQDPQELDRLSLIVHEGVMDEISKRRHSLAQAGELAVVLDVPVPVEEGFLNVCDQVWVVQSPQDLRLQRLAERGMSEAEAKRRMAMQMSEEEYAALASHKIINDGDLAHLTKQVKELAQSELVLRGIPVDLDVEAK